MLQIAIHHCHTVSGSLRKPGCDCRLLAEIPGKMNAVDVFIFLMSLQDLFPGAVLRPVIHEDQLIGDLLSCKKTADGLSRLREALLFVVCRNDYR
jgi:hypothetical protein